MRVASAQVLREGLYASKPRSDVRDSCIVGTATNAQATQACGKSELHASGTRVVSVRRQLGVTPTKQLPKCVDQGIIPSLKYATHAWERGEEARELGEGLGEAEGEETV